MRCADEKFMHISTDVTNMKQPQHPLDSTCMCSRAQPHLPNTAHPPAAPSDPRMVGTSARHNPAPSPAHRRHTHTHTNTYACAHTYTHTHPHVAAHTRMYGCVCANTDKLFKLFEQKRSITNETDSEQSIRPCKGNRGIEEGGE